VIVFKFKANYPDEIPDWDIEEAENITSEEDVSEFLTAQANENLGMPMIYTLALSLIEKLNKDNETRKSDAAAVKETKEREREAEELRKFEGTKVTVEAFLKWKTVFDKEQLEIKIKANADAANKKPTGDQHFFFNQFFLICSGGHLTFFYVKLTLNRLFFSVI
jgi:hypothetical protein